jgi:mannose-6-phosphate isomerase
VLLKLRNNALDYAWGSTTLISDYFGIPATGKTMAEIWFGTHDGSPTEVVGSDLSLQQTLSHAGKSDRLPFLLKILAAEAPLSIQAHPNPGQAKAGFQRENELGLALDAANRNYKDDRAKPELIVALSESFEALVGFADPRLTAEKFGELLEVNPSESLRTIVTNWIKDLDFPEGIKKVFLETLESEQVTESFISELVDLAEQCPSLVDLVSHLTAHHGFDRGIASALLMNHMVLSRGESVFVPAGMPHAYLSGLGVEVMLASDNVLRGGLTPKHIDIAELTKVLKFEATSPSLTKERMLAQGLTQFELPVGEFSFYRVSVSSNNLLMDLDLTGDLIVLCTSGSLAVSNSQDEREVILPGEAAFVAGDARKFSISGSGEGFIAISSN